MKNNWLAWILVPMLCVACVKSAHALWYPPNSVVNVTPGHSIWRVSIGMNRRTVRRLLGEPSQVVGAKEDLWFEVGTGDAAWNDLSYMIVSYDNGKVGPIAASLPQAVVKSDFSVRSTLSQIESKFRGTKKVQGHQEDCFLRACGCKRGRLWRQAKRYRL